jgi:chromosome segregation protein
MVQFSKLRINGFKSFVDRTELEIAPGLNGIVGPNGCGKSNLVEALRWVMGENSPKRMRGGGMEDVIFNGTDKRSPRNIAEVALLLDNSDRKAPAAYNGSDEIEVIRRIERDHGSNYKINGKNVRMRDVQMLFADTVTGANSPALVSQGRITQIINAKPLERRLVLEESAGISGLFARRHEAELRLRAADNNLVRIEDILGSMESRLNDLKRQARQATRYRNVSAQIRQFEILVAYMEWQTLNERLLNARKTFEDAESIVAEKLAVVTQLTKTQNAQSQEITPLRQQEAEAAAALQTQRLALQRIEDELSRLDDALEEAQAQLTQTEIDQQHEQQSLAESTAMLEKLESEQKTIAKDQGNETEILAKKQKTRDELESKVLTLEEKYTALMQNEAESKARKQSLEQAIESNSERLEVVKQRREKAQEELEIVKAQDKEAGVAKELENKTNELDKKANTLNEEIARAEQELETIKEQLQSAREVLSEAENKQSKFDAEIATLESFFEDSGNETYSAVLDDVSAESGFEKALSRALGDSLLASLDDAAPVRWRTRKNIKDMPALPNGVQSLLPHVKAPKELHLALSQIGFVAGESGGDELAESLLPGQSLVSENGTYWRWDGFCMKAEATDRNAVHLEQKNKLKELEQKKPNIETAVQKARAAVQLCKDNQEKAESTYKSLKENMRENDEALRIARADLANMRESRARYESEVTRLSETASMAQEDIKTLEEVIAWDRDRLKAYEEQSDEKQAEEIEDLRATLNETRESYNAAIRAFDSYQQEQNSRKARLHAIADERINLQNRSIRARERLKDLEERKTSLSEKLTELKNQPKDFAKDKEKLLSLISELEEKRGAAAEKLSEAENEVTETGRALKEAEAMLSEARESRAHSQGTTGGIQEQIQVMTTHIEEQFDMSPEALKEHAPLELIKDGQELDDLKQKKEKLTRERDNIGAVNLRAEEESAELEKEVTTLLNERNDLIQAIEELRGGIQKINTEARERLISAFEHVNAHFQHLFSQLFAGGKAHLALIDSDDPLESGLEIFAQPPGKALQSLSLLSGGEQTLASIALIFAMFLTNPSPICVLDEIDAPLDDANVDRVCNLLEEISERGETRFVIITHHRMTMARMDRLYGVTMAEKGVSQLVSVDLQQSFDFLEEAA